MLKKVLFSICLSLIISMTSCSKNNSPSVQEGQPRIDLDLTKMSASLIYSNVFNMMVDPDSFKGKTIKVDGNFRILNGPNGEIAWTVIVPDATACCEQGLSFTWGFGEDVPATDTPVTVTGIFTIKEIDDGIYYSYLTGTEVTIKE